MKKSALASVKSDRWRHLAPKYQTFGSIRVLKTGRFNFFSLHHYPQHKCGETLSPRWVCLYDTVVVVGSVQPEWESAANGGEAWAAVAAADDRGQAVKHWNKLRALSYQWTLEQRDCTDIVKEFSWSWIHLLRYCNNKLFLAATVSQKILYDIMHRERQFHRAIYQIASITRLNPSQLFSPHLFSPTAKSRSISCSWVITPANNGLLYLVCYWKQLRRIHSDYKVEEHIISEKDEDGGLQQLVSKWDECSGNGVPASGYKCWDQCAEDTAKWWTYCWT